MQQPDRVLAAGEYDVIIASPSVATGVSIEVQGVIDLKYTAYSQVHLRRTQISPKH